VSSEALRSGEKIILQEDCAEDKLKNGILTLTNQRIIFEKTEGRMATLSKKTGDIVLDIPLNKISFVESQGFIIAKVIIGAGDKIYKFGVLNTGKWAKTIKEQVTSLNKSE
jgi:hypothetical protein